MTDVRAAPGLCAMCRHGLIRPTARETSYLRCLRSKSDPSFAKYPRLPVLECPGFELRDADEGGIRED